MTVALETLPIAQAAPEDLGALNALGTLDLDVALISADFRLVSSLTTNAKNLGRLFHVVGGRVVFSALETRARFEHTLDRARAGARDNGTEWASDVFAVSYGSVLPLLVRVLAAQRKQAPAALIIVLDPHHHCHVPESLLQSAFNLTAAEASLASSLTSGRTLKQIGTYSNVQISTLRSQLACVLAKTNTSRQAELVSLLSRVAMMLPRERPTGLLGLSER